MHLMLGLKNTNTKWTVQIKTSETATASARVCNFMAVPTPRKVFQHRPDTTLVIIDLRSDDQ